MNSTDMLRQIRWKCRRGMLELDLMLSRLVDRHGQAMSDAELQTLMQLLECEDDQLWDWMTGRGQPEDSRMKQLVQQIRAID